MQVVITPLLSTVTTNINSETNLECSKICNLYVYCRDSGTGMSQIFSFRSDGVPSFPDIFVEQSAM
jgi:hypothetical protein